MTITAVLAIFLDLEAPLQTGDFWSNQCLRFIEWIRENFSLKVCGLKASFPDSSLTQLLFFESRVIFLTFEEMWQRTVKMSRKEKKINLSKNCPVSFDSCFLLDLGPFWPGTNSTHSGNSTHKVTQFHLRLVWLLPFHSWNGFQSKNILQNLNFPLDP